MGIRKAPTFPQMLFKFNIFLNKIRAVPSLLIDIKVLRQPINALNRLVGETVK